MAETSDKIRVCVRIKPEGEQAKGFEVSGNNLTFATEGRSETFSFDEIYGKEVGQKEVFERAALQTTENCLEGYNGTIFAYGQTGSGKTYTMQGLETERGIIPRAIEHLFGQLSRLSSGGDKDFECRCSYIEIYNEVVYDLLGTGQACNLREDIRRGVYVDGCTYKAIESSSEALAMFTAGAANRHVGATCANHESSRSHAVFTIFLCVRRGTGLVDMRHSQFNLVDLAGSERQQSTKTTGKRLKEAGCINKSLFALGNVINSLVEVSGGHLQYVHYRDSKLTFLLRDSFGGNAKTLLIANITLSGQNVSETISTLKFAQRAKLIRNKAVLNAAVEGTIDELKAEVTRLRAQTLAGGPDTKGGMLVDMALQRQREVERNYEALSVLHKRLEEACEKKDKQIQAERLIVKLRDNALRQLRDGASTQSELEKQQGEEIAELRRQLTIGEKTASLVYENTALKGRLLALEKFSSEAEKHEQQLDKMRKYQQLLLDRLAKTVDEDRPQHSENHEDNQREEGVSQMQRELEMRETRLHGVVVQLHEMKTKNKLMAVEHEIMVDEMQYLSRKLAEKEEELFRLRETLSQGSMSDAGAESGVAEDCEGREQYLQRIHALEETAEARAAGLEECLRRIAELEEINGNLLKHNNPKQKIQYLHDVKLENKALHERLAVLEDENRRLRDA
eukprot:GHVN01052374.1.p1 GENE.GHVN01052374.1~~GHVN01052374.1.p1  ORF type:complete len:680 (+),score=85.29 GHVN01052374.1:974-3013(+)